MDLDVSNDPEIERLGANHTALAALEFWDKLAEAARKDGKLLDPIWKEDANDDPTNETNGTNLALNSVIGQTTDDSSTSKDAHYTTMIVISRNAEEDMKLYKRFRANFSGLSVQNLRSSEYCSPLGGPKWESLLLASEGLIQDFNFMTLLREDAYTPFFMTEEQCCDGLMIVPRAQFIFCEVARIKEGVYNSKFRRMLELFDFKTQAEALQGALDKNDIKEAEDCFKLVVSQWPYPRKRSLLQSGILRVLRNGAKSSQVSTMISQGCSNILKYWQDLYDLRRFNTTLSNLNGEKKKNQRSTNDLLPRAAVALSEKIQNSFRISPMNNHDDEYAEHQTRKLSDLTTEYPCTNPTLAAKKFKDQGIVILENVLSDKELRGCKEQASQAFNALCEEQLKPRGLSVDGSNEFDFQFARQRPGHRVDNRYKVLDDRTSPIALLGQRLLEELPKSLLSSKSTTTEHISYKMLYGGVVHSFPRLNESDDAPDPQFWHRDVPSVFEDNFHDTVCFNVFIPLIDVTSENGTTEFVPGTHDDKEFETILPELLKLANTDPSAKHDLAIRAECNSGSIIVFDGRCLHRGLSNTSNLDRPMLYFTFAKSWFEEVNMFKKEEQSLTNTSPSSQKQENDAHRKLVQQLYQMVTNSPVDISESEEDQSYGHPHYTTRFDLMLLENISADYSAGMENVSAIMKFTAIEDKKGAVDEAVRLLQSNSTLQQKYQVLSEAKEKRKEERAGQDFASIATDMSDVNVLYTLLVKILLEESVILKDIGFTKNSDGLLMMLAVFKAYASSCGTSQNTGFPGPEVVEESLTQFWHAGNGRFELKSAIKTGTEGLNNPKHLLVVFSSLGSGIARPEWGGTLKDVAPSSQLDVLHVLDPAFSWYMQDPTCQWKGYKYYQSKLQSYTKGYVSVMFLGDSMGGAGALCYSTLADTVLAFTPQVDISQYEAITRKDFSISVRKSFQDQLLASLEETRAKITIHYGEFCEEDCRHVSLLSSPSFNINLIPHDYDDHILSLHLKEQGKLKSIVRSAIESFLRK